jgi:hypothetical protein
MDWTIVLIVVGVVVTLAVVLVSFSVLNALGFGPDNDPSARDEDELGGPAV